MKKCITALAYIAMAALVIVTLIAHSFWFTLFVCFCLALMISPHDVKRPEKYENESTTHEVR